jgi:hypothetical protein
MKFTDLFKTKNIHNIIIFLVLILYILLDVQTPEPLANLIDNIYGQVVLIIVALSIFPTVHPVIGVMILLASYFLIQRSSLATGNYGVSDYLSSDEKNSQEMIAQNSFPKTLEEEVIYNMTPSVYNVGMTEPTTYKPILDSQIPSSSV